VNQVVGTCSLCGGAVSFPLMSTLAVASCDSCGAKPKTPHGPTIEMDPNTRRKRECPNCGRADCIDSKSIGCWENQVGRGW
jgi:hypothetical protein